MNLSDFDFDLPEHLIAQAPASERDGSKMMVVWRETGKREHRVFRELPDILNSEHFLVINNTRVFSARLRACRPGRREEIEILLLRETAPREWLALIKPARKAPAGGELVVCGRTARVLEASESGSRLLRFEYDGDLEQLFEQFGEPPIPPYIHRSKGADLSIDKIRYQTVYARHSGSVAAPTAGLHFTEEVFRRLQDRGIPICEVLLHVGYGTFKPVRCENILEHTMEAEYFELDAVTAGRIRTYKSGGRRLVAVGTTTTRCLEYLATGKEALEHAASGFCNLFIYPGFQFRMLDGLVTNFHLPRSTLFMLASAFAGRDLLADCYQEAIANNYRFYSYGDCMLIL
jgi:S-adenosylmethionine:tRNA ribosyltransferase-isomerase